MSDSRVFAWQDARTRERTILKNVYLWMTAGLSLTGVIAWGIGNNPAYLQLISRFFLVAILAEIGLVLFLSSRINRMSSSAAITSFVLYAALNGMTLAPIFMIYTGTAISNAFFGAAATFGGMAIYGMTTKKDLAGWGYYLRMGVWGIIAASLINFFIGSSTVNYLVSYAGVALFLGLTAYDTQAISRMSMQYSGSVDETVFMRMSIMGALKLYLDFINLFLFVLRIFGRRN